MNHTEVDRLDPQNEVERILSEMAFKCAGGITHSGRKEYTPAKAALLSYLLSHVIGEDEKHDNGQKMVNDPADCMDCTNPDERFCRNQLRAKQRAVLTEILNPNAKDNKHEER